MRTLTYAQAGLEALAEEMRLDPKIFHLCTDAPPALLEEFGARRIRATPIAESALTGMAIGAAGSGYRPVVDWRMVTFCFVAMDQIVNQAANIHYMFGGQARFPILFRASVGGGTRRAAQHSQSPYSMFMNLAGLKMILPSTPRDLKGLLKSAIRDDNPVISFESERLMALTGEVPDEDCVIELGKAEVKREGRDVTVVALAWLVHEALAAAETLAQEGISVEVVDPRTLVPMDVDTIRASVRKTGRLLVADEAGPTAGASAEVATLVTEDPGCFRALEAPVKRVCALQVPIPYGPQLEDHVFPDRHTITAGVRELMGGDRGRGTVTLAPGRIGLVTGASSGIGLAVAESLILRGMKVIALARTRQRLEDAFRGHPQQVVTRALDVTDGPAVSGLLASLPQAWREVDVVIANAGSDRGGRRDFTDGEMNDWAATIDTNVTGVMRICHALLPGMQARGRGHVVAIGSNAGLAAYAGGAAYAASKFAVRAFAQALRLEYKTSPIRITEVLPGLVRTGFAAARHGGDEQKAAAFYDSAPAALQPRDIADAVLFALQAPPHVNVGQILITPTGNK